MTAWKAVVVSLAASLVAASAEAGFGVLGHEFTHFPVPNSAGGIAIGPTGDVWFTGDDRIGRLRAGVVTEFATPTAISSPLFITAGPDGNMWFTQYNSSAIGRITANGAITEFPLPSSARQPADIESGPDGNLWFTAAGSGRGIESGRVGRITPQGTISLFVTEPLGYDITRGPDDALWFTTELGRGIGRMATNGQRRIFPFDREHSGIATGPDGALWFLVRFRDFTVGRMTTDGEVSTFTAPSPPGDPLRIIRGPEDNLWFTTFRGGISRINLAGTIEEILPPAAADNPYDIAAGVDGRIWFSQQGASPAIGRLDSLAFGTLDVPNSALLGLARGADDSIWFADAGGRIGRIGPDGSFVQHELGIGDRPTALAVGADGSAWFTDGRADTIGRITTDGERVEYTIPSPPSGPRDFVLGPDGNFWFTEYDAGSLGRITPQGVIRRFPVGDVDTVGTGARAPRAMSASR